MQITTEEMEKNVMYLAETDAEMARSKAFFHGLDRQTKTIKAMQFMRSNESSATAREQAALVSPSYREHLVRVQDAETDYLTLAEKRATAIVLIDCWRSLNAARNRGSM